MRIAFLAAAVALMTGQAGQSAYVGTWTATIAGNTFVRVELNLNHGVWAGRIGIGDFQVAADGDVKAASPIPQMRPISDVSLRGSTMSFASKDGDDTDHFEMELVGPESARLKVILTDADLREAADAGVPAPKPIALTRLQQ